MSELYDDHMDWDDYMDEYDFAADEAYSEYMRQQDEEDERLRDETPIYAALADKYMTDAGERHHG